MSRDVQVRVLFCDWLAQLLRMKRSGHDVSIMSLTDKRQNEGHIELKHETDYTGDGNGTLGGLPTSVSVRLYHTLI